MATLYPCVMSCGYSRITSTKSQSFCVTNFASIVTNLTAVVCVMRCQLLHEYTRTCTSTIPIAETHRFTRTRLGARSALVTWPRLTNVICPFKPKTSWNYTRYSHCIGWVDPIAGVEAVMKRNICCPFRKANSVICGFLACSQATIEPGRSIIL